jgi:hypothetical protein
VPNKPEPIAVVAPENSRMKRYSLGTVGGLALAGIAYSLLGNSSRDPIGGVLIIMAAFGVAGLLSTALLTSRKSGIVFSFFTGFIGTLFFVAVTVALNAMREG